MQEEPHHSLEVPQAGLRITPTDRIAMAALAGQQKKTESATCIEYCSITAGQKACRLMLVEPSTGSDNRGDRSVLIGLTLPLESTAVLYHAA